jgi:hypothetical protein
MMVIEVSAVVVLALLRSLGGANGSEAGHYEEISKALADAANADPLYTEREDGAARAVSVLGAIAWYESRLKPSAVGDGGRSFGLFQIMPAVWKVEADTLLSPRTAAPVALALVKRSFRECKKQPWGHRLAWYAASSTCEPGKVHPKVLAQSALRMQLADKLFRQFFPEHVTIAASEPSKDPT